jgi:hypothetical protein
MAKFTKEADHILDNSPFMPAEHVVKPEGPSYDSQKNPMISPTDWRSRTRKRKILKRDDPDLFARQQAGEEFREKSSTGLAELLNPDTARAIGMSLPRESEFGLTEPSAPGLETTGVRYINPLKLPTRDRDAVLQYWKEKGYPPQGMVGPNGEKIVFIDPHNKIVDIGARGGIKRSRDLDPETGLNIGVIEGDELKYAPQETYDQNLIRLVKGTWEEGKQEYADQITRNLDKFNRRVNDWLEENPGLFDVHFPNTLVMAAKGIYDTIGDMINNIDTMQGRIQQGIGNNQQGIELQESEFQKYLNMVRKPENFRANPKEWFQALLLVYKNSMEAIADNVLKIPYPMEFIAGIVQPFSMFRGEGSKKPCPRCGEDDAIKNVTSNQMSCENCGNVWYSNVRGKGPKTSLENMLSREEIGAIQVEPEVGAEQRAIVRDTDVHQGLANPLTGKSNMLSQSQVIMYGYEEDKTLLNNILDNLHLLEQARQLLPSAKLTDAVSSPAEVEEIDKAAIRMIDSARRLFTAPVVNDDGKLLGSLAVGDESKFELYVKLIYIIQAYNRWRTAIQGKGAKPLNIPQIADQLGLLEEIDRNAEGTEGTEERVASISTSMIKTAQSCERRGMYKISDLFLDMARLFG